MECRLIMAASELDVVGRQCEVFSFRFFVSSVISSCNHADVDNPLN